MKDHQCLVTTHVLVGKQLDTRRSIGKEYHKQSQHSHPKIYYKKVNLGFVVWERAHLPYRLCYEHHERSLEINFQ